MATAGSDQATATAITKTVNIISTATLGEGVRLPAALGGYVLIVRNSGLDDANVYPGTGASIAGGAVNDPIVLIPNSSVLLFAADATSWFIVNATFA